MTVCYQCARRNISFVSFNYMPRRSHSYHMSLRSWREEGWAFKHVRGFKHVQIYLCIYNLNASVMDLQTIQHARNSR